MMSARPDHELMTSRRQAVNACQACRLRKTKCDEGMPQCGRCKRLRLDCVYSGHKSSQSITAVVELNSRLKSIEATLSSISKLVSGAPDPTVFTNQNREETRLSQTASPHEENIPQSSIVSEISTEPGQKSQANTEAADNSLAIPASHTTAPQNMLQWPCCPIPLSQEELHYPVVLEIERESLPLLRDQNHSSSGASLDHLSVAQLRELSSHYFTFFHPHTLILDKESYYSLHLIQAMQSGFSPSLDSCLVLVVLALGAVASAQLSDASNIAALDSSSQIPTSVAHILEELDLFSVAVSYFQVAEQVNWMSVKCLLLMSLFHSCQLRAYDQWSMINRACSKIIILMSIQSSPLPQHCTLYWIAYSHESQILAELSFPPSGISRLENTVPLPFANADSEQQPENEYQFFFLAQIALRRLLNRIHSNLYKHGLPQSVSTGDDFLNGNISAVPRKVIQELDRQLELWRAHLPPSLQFANATVSDVWALGENAEPRSIHERLHGNMQSRYYAAKAILYRPFVYNILNCDSIRQLTSDEREGASIALEAALLIPLKGGLLRDRLVFLPLPINSCRSFYAAAIQVSLVLISKVTPEDVLPENWRVIYRIREIVALQTASSPVLTRDLKILGHLERFI